jgi:[acyl-carrier-protein] S-malonyltransferase
VDAPFAFTAEPIAPMTCVLMFPGQSSADPQMIQRAARLHPASLEVLRRAESALGVDQIRPYTDPAGVRLRSNRDIQISVFLATQMHLAALDANGIETGRSLGLSLGEYSHLVHIGALTFEAALGLVAQRGAAYDDARPGIMVTVLGADRAQVEEAVARAGPDGDVRISNYNTPTQHVLAGTRAAVESTARWLEEECGAHTIETESRVPMHTPLLADVAERFRSCLKSAPWQRPADPYLPNVSARPHFDAGPDVFIEQLTRHVTEPVRWQDSIETVAACEPAADFVEVGPGEVLHNMLGRRWMAVRRARTDDTGGANPAEHLRRTAEGLRARA